ncbi:hypothetical protein HDV01_006484 [Terramyces sp. JEL0728]|nr:hypothetical protein HDV01_006484 [Terramyces sp. JEL0728]
MNFEQYKDRITELIKENIDTITKKQLRKSISSEYNVDLAEYKTEFDKYAMDILESVIKLQDTKPKAEKSEDSDDDSVLIDTKKKSNGGLCSLSPALSELIGETELGRMQITKKIWDYIKGNSLQDEKDRRYILCDDKLIKVFKTKRMHMMKMAKLLQPHLTQIIVEKKRAERSGEPKKGGFNKHHKLSTELQQLIQVETESRPQVVKRIWDYIKANGLQDPSNKQHINNDEKMFSVFQTNRMTMFGMNKLIGKHLSPLDE